MKIPRVSFFEIRAFRFLAAGAALLPALASAHPGHYHPDETDEFDFLKAVFLHSHGSLDYALGAVAVASAAVACLHGRPAVRIGAAAAALGSLAMLPII